MDTKGRNFVVHMIRGFSSMLLILEYRYINSVNVIESKNTRL